ncbi:phage baseplate assembly protein V [Marinibactrum halimedae]|uniref:Phage tail protein n=1 Tax=Marinibactrum halimedae TaxID=1444977 RepID=A0AA37TAF9_9GAMM|nr:phage baseplate assembly protein V [Marinibactrum halimedae]MCD9460626.1 phage baseplate assembly protein V [Marinibactrum halimedae]GLS27842.1 phage tail protein [Marinibactrum halimedae]
MNPHTLGQLNTLQLGRVIDNDDPEQRGRIKVQLHSVQVALWASVVAPSAGQNYGVSALPKLEETVVIGFLNPDTPLVLGSLWCGNASTPEDITSHEEQYVIRTPAGTVVEFNDEQGPKVEMRTRSGYRVTVTEDGGGEIQLERGGQSVTLSPSSIDINASGPVNINASQVSVSASMVQVDAGISRFSGVVQADTVIATSVVGTTYTPGAGNVW